MPTVTVICFLSSLLSYGMGFSKMSALKDGITEQVTTYNTLYVSLATGYFVLAIFFGVIGFLFFYVKSNREQAIIEIMTANSEDALISI